MGVARLGQLERAVMEALWDLGAVDLDHAVAARAVSEALPDRAYTTILTVLDRLAKKEFVIQVRDGRSHHFAARRSRERYIAELMEDALADTNDRSAALVRFVESATPDDAATLREVLARLDGRRPDRL